jgi:hypothetical protein
VGTEPTRSSQSFAAWCDYARQLVDQHAGELAVLIDELADTDPLAAQLLRLRAFTLGDRERLGAPAHPLAPTLPVAIFAGAAASMSVRAGAELESLLRSGLRGFAGTVISGGTAVGVPGVVGRVSRELGLTAIGYVPEGHGDTALYSELRHTPGATDFSIGEPLAMWTDILGAGIAVEDARVVVCPGGEITIQELLLARALGAPVAWLDPAGDSEAPPHDLLPGGDEGVLALPAHAPALRAFLDRAA